MRRYTDGVLRLPERSTTRGAVLALLVLSGCKADRPSPAPATTLPGATTTLAAPPTTTAPVPRPADRGRDFAAEVRLLYRVVACAGDEAIPAALDAAVVKEHCAALRPRIEAHRKRYLAQAKPFLAALRPPGLPPAVVYPAGGGDLLSALTTYPEGREYTTLSLELSGDPRRLATLDKPALTTSLALIRQQVGPLLSQNNSTSENLMKGQRGEIPGQIAFFLIALAVHDYEPVSLRYFRIEPDGGLHYFSEEEIAASDRAPAGRLKGEWTPPDFAPTFSNAEIVFRPRGAADGETRIHRHIAANLADGPLAKQPGLLKHLEAKERISALTKAASYLLWRRDFSTMRNYLLSHMDLMISDSTGIPPSYAEAAGFTLETYGRFQGSFLPASGEYNDQFRKVWQRQPQRPLPFRYGYPDSAGAFHLVVSRPVRKGSTGMAALAPDIPVSLSASHGKRAGGKRASGTSPSGKKASHSRQAPRPPHKTKHA